MSKRELTIGIVGGTGDLGTGLAFRWSAAGYVVSIGSREQAKAEAAAIEVRDMLNNHGNDKAQLRAGTNVEVAADSDIVVMTVPFAHHSSTLNSIRDAISGKILVDVTVPLVPPKVARVQLPPEGSAGQIAQSLLGTEIRVVSAFQNVAAHHLKDGNELSCDVLVCGNNKDARSQVISLVEAAGMRGFHAGSINNAAAVEAMTSLLIFINKRYSCHAGVRITGVDG